MTAQRDADAWFAGRRLTWDGTPECLLRTLPMLGARIGALVAVDHPDRRVLEVVRRDGGAELRHRPDLDFADVRRGHPAIDPEDVAAALPPDAAELIRSGTVLVVDPWSDEVPSEVAREFERSMSGGGSRIGTRPLACCTRRDDGRVLIVLAGDRIDPVAVRHEAIHAAQCLADDDAMGAAIDAVVEDGRRILAAAKARPGDRFDDLDWAAGAWRAPTAPLDILADARNYLPGDATARICEELGIVGPDAAAAAVCATLAHAGPEGIDAWGTLGRELVAYRFQHQDATVVDELFASARRSIEPATAASFVPSP